jgi:tetratricopeptide (TPR) repeat protein
MVGVRPASVSVRAWSKRVALWYSLMRDWESMNERQDDNRKEYHMTIRSDFDLESLVGQLVQANELRHRERYQEALEVYLKVFDHWKEDADLRVLIGYCYLAFTLSPNATSEDLQTALAWMKDSIVAKPNEARLYSLLGQFYFLVRVDYSQAAWAYRKAIELSPDNIEALAGIASLYFIPVNVVILDEALNCLEHAVKLESNNPIFHFNLGQLYRKADRVPEAKREWIKALLSTKPLDPGSARTIAKSYGVAK